MVLTCLQARLHSERSGNGDLGQGSLSLRLHEPSDTQVLLFKPSDFVVVRGFEVVPSNQGTMKLPENQSFQTYFFGASLRILRTMSSSSFITPDCGKRGTSSIQFLSVAKIS